MTAIRPHYVVVRGRRGFRGLGQDGDVAASIPEGTVYNFPDTTVPITGTVSPTASSGGGTSTPSPGWSFFQNLINQAGQTARVALSPLSALPRGTYYSQTPYGTVVSSGGGAGVASSLSTIDWMPILLIGGLVVVMMMSRER